MIKEPGPMVLERKSIWLQDSPVSLGRGELLIEENRSRKRVSTESGRSAKLVELTDCRLSVSSPSADFAAKL